MRRLTRSTLRTLTTTIAAGALLATLIPSAGAEQKVLIRGGGWGHGIGMSQYGAYGLALRGKSASQILRHYYKGVSVSSRKMPNVRVGLLQYESSIGMSSVDGPVAFRVAGAKSSIANGGAAADWTIEPSPTGRMRIYKNGNLVVRDGQRAFGGPSKPLRAVYEQYGSAVHVVDKGIAYRYGRLEIGTYASSSCGAGYCLRLVMKSSMEKYLYGLGEVPSSWPQAVLQAQAIAGRTYAYRKIRAYGQHRSPCDCAVVDSVYDQAYIGDAKRTGSGEYWDDWKRAVDRSAGNVILYNGDPIEALYSSSSGGYTENNENVWGGSPVPYLRGVKDPSDSVSANPNHSWSFTMTRSELSSQLNAAYGTGSLKRIKLVRPFGVSGRVTVVKSNGGGVRIAGTSKTVRVSGWSLRSALGLKDTLFRIDLFYPVWWRMRPKHERLGGAPGLALSKSYVVPRNSDGKGLGRAQNFEQGRMTWRRKTDKTVWQSGPVLKRYDRMGRERSKLGMPTSDIWGPGGFLGASYEDGLIVWTRKQGAFGVVEAFAREYRSHGGPKGALGVPHSARRKAASLPNGGWRQAFARGRIYGPPNDAGIYSLWGPIADRYVSLGEAGSDCGYPTSDVRKEKGVSVASFRNGTISHSPKDGVTVDCPKSSTKALSSGD